MLICIAAKTCDVIILSTPQRRSRAQTTIALVVSTSVCLFALHLRVSSPTQTKICRINEISVVKFLVGEIYKNVSVCTKFGRIRTKAVGILY